MTTKLNIRHQLYMGPTVIKDPGYSATESARTITIDKDGGVCPVVTTGTGDTRTLRRPTKAGIVGTVVLYTDDGDLTLTVTGGYNADADTSITFDDAGDFVRFMSIDVGGTYYWRVVAHEGTNVAVEDVTVDTLTVATLTAPTVAAEHGAGFVSTAYAPITTRRIENGTIITEIKFDLDGLAVQGDTGKDVIGLSAAAASYFGKYVVANYGIVYRMEVICIVVPSEETATIALDLDIGADNQSLAQNATADDVVLDMGTVAAGGMYIDNLPALTADDYLYLIEGAGTDGATGEYSGGQFIIRFYGHAVV